MINVALFVCNYCHLVVGLSDGHGALNTVEMFQRTR